LANNDNISMLEVFPQQPETSTNTLQSTVQDLNYFERIFAKVHRNTFEYLVTVKRKADAQISFELPNSKETLFVPSEFGDVSDVIQSGNQVTINLVPPSTLDVPTDFKRLMDNTNYKMDFGAYRPEVCELTSNVSFNNCIDNNNGTFTANYDVNISWIDGPSEDIQVLVNGVVTQTIISGTTSPQTVAINLTADGVGQDTIITTFASTSTCADTLIVKSPTPCADNVATCASTTGCIGGKAFEDFNCNGTDDTAEDGLQGIQVIAYDCQNNAIDTVWTDNDGDWQICGLTDGAAYRVEFILPESIACWASPTHAGSDNGTDVQFLTAPACTKFGLSNPVDYCEADPFVIIPCFSIGAFDGATSGETAIVKLRESADGHDFIGTTKTAGFEADSLADHNDVGAIYGVAWQPTKKRYYLSAFHKRYVGFGPDGPDAIYQYDLDGNKTGTINLDAILATTNSAGSDVHDFTPADMTDPHPGEVYDLGVGESSFDGVGKLAFGDIELSDDGSTLYVINLFDRKIYALDVSSGNTNSTTIIQTWDTPDETTAGRHRPFALAYHEGKLWVGSVDENGTNAYVHSLLPTSNAFNLELTIPLNYNRQAFILYENNPAASSNWNAWATNSNVPYIGETFAAPPEIGYPQPILSDIEFADNGDMILGFRDRFGDQSGAGVYLNPSETELTFSISAGDILKACFQSGSFVLETGGGSCAGAGGLGSSGPGGTEFYSWDIYNYLDVWSPIKPFDGGIHWETTQGALLQLKGNPYVMTTAMDPFSDYSGGVIKLNNTTGGREGVNIDSVNYVDLVGGYTLFESAEYDDLGTVDPITLGKANGLGDLEAACESAPLEIGNYVWCDSIPNGIQDACERGIDNLLVQLYKADGTLIGQDITINGNYYFNQNNVDTTGITVDGVGNISPVTAWSGMNYSTSYFIVFGNGQYNNSTGRLLVEGISYEGFSAHDVNSNGNDNIDSDIDATSLTTAIGSLPANLPVISMTTTATGCGDHKYDVGVRCAVYDYGDLPDIANGTTGVTDYETYDATGGPSHQIVAGLFLGDTVDFEMDGFPDAQALGDDNDNVDDEDGVNIFSTLNVTPGGMLRLPLSVTNTTGDTAYVEAWIDWNGDGAFDGLNEMVADLKDNEDGVFPSFLTINVPYDAISGVQVGFRIRLSHEDDMTPYGRVSSGEIEDYLLGIDCPQIICPPIQIQINKE